MIKKILILTSMLLLFNASPALASKNVSQDLLSACDGNNNLVQSSPFCSDKEVRKNPVAHVFGVAADLLALVAGVVAVIMIILAGLTMITSAGNQENVAAARRRIVSALIGLVVIALAWGIIKFITSKVLQ